MGDAMLRIAYIVEGIDYFREMRITVAEYCGTV